MKVIGRRDRIDLPKLGLKDIDAKIDTGAFGNALHCHAIKVMEKGGKKVLSFQVLDPEHPEFADRTFYSDSYDYKFVKSSTGESEKRYTIVSDVVLFAEVRTVEFSLTDRSKMKYPILLGRKFLSKHYLVDVQVKNVSFNQKNNMK